VVVGIRKAYGEDSPFIAAHRIVKNEHEFSVKHLDTKLLLNFKHKISAIFSIIHEGNCFILLTTKDSIVIFSYSESGKLTILKALNKVISGK